MFTQTFLEYVITKHRLNFETDSFLNTRLHFKFQKYAKM